MKQIDKEDAPIGMQETMRTNKCYRDNDEDFHVFINHPKMGDKCQCGEQELTMEYMLTGKKSFLQ